MKSYNNIKTSTKIAMAISIALVALIFVSSIMGLIKDTQTLPAIKIAQIIANIATVIMILYYMLFGYKKPHGNSLRNIFVISAILIIARLILPHTHIENDVLRYVAKSGFGLAAILIAFVGGRLNKIKQNKILMIIIGVSLLIPSVIVAASFPEFIFMRGISSMAQPIGWLALCIAYVARFEEHKAAGLADKADVEEK